MLNLIEKLFPNYFIRYLLNGNKVFNYLISKHCRLQLHFLSLLTLFFVSSLNLSAQVCGTSGLDGPQNAVPPVNTYFPLAANATLPAGTKTITLLGVPPNDPNYNLSYGVTPIRSGDLILIIQMQDAEANFVNSNLYGSGSAINGPDGLGGTGYTTLGNSGKFEYVVATSDVALTGGLLEFRGAGAGSGAVNTYTNADFTATSTRGQRRFQVVRVPQYSNLVLNSNITTPPYNGSVGGIIAFDVAGTMEFNGFSVDASQRGFRGGYGPVAGSGTNTSTLYTALSSSTRSVGKGEGIAGTPRYMWNGFIQVDNVAEGLPGGSYGRGAPGNAGGAGNDHNAGGGGGGNAGFGGIGGRGWQGGNGDLNPLTGGGRPGSSIPLDYSRLIMGGGGGGGDANNATSGVKGGVGGGIILINVDRIAGAGTIRANGGIGEAGAFNSSPDGAGGGGAGGSIFVRSLSASTGASLTLEANGGNGGNTLFDTGTVTPHGPGGGGGGGFIYTQVPSATIISSISGGLAGKTNNGAGITHGAIDGTAGQASNFTTTDLPSHLQGGGFICYPILTTTLTELNAGAAGIRPPGSTATYKLRVANAIGGGNAGGVGVDFQLPFGFSLSNVSVVLSGDAAGPTTPSFTVGASGKITFGTYNISPGDYIEFTILVNISNNIPSGIYQASAQATYLDPTRTNLNPLRKITANHQQFAGSNTSYETGGIGNVPGFNYNGNLNSSIVEDVYINAPPLATDCNAITNGDFTVAAVQEYDAPNYLGSWGVVNSGDKVKIVSSISDNTDNVAFIKDGFSLQQTILSIKPSTNYSLGFSYIKNNICGNTSSASKFKIEILNATTLAVLSNTNLDNADASPRNANISFTTSASTTSLIIKISDDLSANNACAVLIDDIVVTSPLDFQIEKTNVSCNGVSDGSFSVVALSGGAAPYTISYSSDNGVTYSASTPSGIIPQTSGLYTITGLPAGTYKVRILDSNGCGDPAKDITINQPDLLVLSGTNTAILCNSATSTVTLTTTGGTAPFKYSIDNGTTFQTQNTFPNLAAGTYNFLVEDANGCRDTYSISFTEPANLTLSTVLSTISCFGGTANATLTANGGTGAHEFSVDGISYQASNSFSNLPAGDYIFRVRDANGCIREDLRTITQPTQLTTSITAQTNVSCFGGNTGSVTVAGANGTGPYTYSLNGGAFQSTSTFTGLIAATYTVTVRDVNGCEVPQTVTITQPAAALSATSTQVNVNCFGGTTGSINLTPAGGAAPYSYNWGGGIITEDRTNLAAGTYTVTVTDANGCTTPLSATITQPAAALSATSTQVNVNCFGGTTGSINLTPAGGAAPYSYNWGGGIITEDRTNLTAGTYTVTVTDANGCTTPLSATITQPAAALSATLTQVNVNCFGGTTGSINLTPAGGAAPYSYNWGGGIITEDRTNLAAGTYTVTVTDANGCTTPLSATITQPTQLTTSITTQTNVSCFGGNTGSVTVAGANGTGPYTYSLNGGAFQSTNTFTGLIAATYTVTVRDVNGCEVPQTVTITQPAAALSATSTQVNVNCFGGTTGSINLTPAGGVAPYSYNWGGGITTEDRTNLAAGTYTVTVTDANGCTTPLSTTITQPSVLTINETQTNINCNGDSSGSININISGGTGPYTFVWSNGATTLNQTNLPAGTYTIAVTDANNCSTSKNITISQPPSLLINASKFDVKCFGESTGSINITVTGGTAPYAYAWSNGATIEDLTGLNANSYSLTVTDSKGCLSFATIPITQPLSPITISETHINNTCFSENQGSIDLTVSGGVGPYLYSWNNGSITQDINNLAPGIYTATVTDANNCVSTKTITITPLAPLAITNSPINLLCNSIPTGEIALNITGGTLPYVITWNNGATSASLQNLSAGTYTYKVRDNNGCEITNSVTITEPASLTITGNNTAILCNGDLSTVTLNSTGGTGAYQYSKDGSTFQSANIFSNLAAGSYTFSVKDANNCIKTFPLTIIQPALLTITGNNTAILCNGDLSTVTLNSTGGTGAYQYSKDGTTFQPSNIFSSLAAGVYTFSVKDANNCIKTFPLTITQPALLTITGSNTAILCNGDLSTVTLNSTGGTGAYQYSKDGSTFQSSNIFSNLSAGSYTFSVKDANNCIKTFPLIITQPPLLTITGNNTSILCNGDLSTVTLSSTGGKGAYQYSKDGTTYQSSNIFSNLPAAVYTFMVKDANNCIKTFSTTITQPTALTISSTQQNVLCFGQATGSINMSISGGTAPYTYAWNNGAITEDLSTLIAGTYTLIVTDANQCKLNKTIVITQPTAALNVTEAHQNIKCFGDASGSINISVSGGTAPYTYLWSNGVNTEDLSSLIVGNYSVTVTDANNCSATTSVTITQPTAALAATEVHQDVNCFGVANGAIDISVSGGTSPYKYSWSNNATSQDISSLLAGNYSVVITDANDCKTTLNIAIQQPSAPLSITENHQNILCFGQATGSINISVNGGTAPYTYLWNNGVTTKDLNGITAGTYNVVITDAKGCIISKQIQITQPNAPLSITDTRENVKCFGDLTGKIDISVFGGTAPYSYLWSNGITTQDLSNLPSGTYSVTVTDANRCVISKQIQITQPVAPLSLTETHIDNVCFGDKIGSINVSVSGGTAPYTYNWNTGQTTQDLTNLAGGLYTLTVADANNCTKNISVTITPLQAFVVTESIQNVKCFNESTGSITLNLIGGQSPYTVTWSNGATGAQLSNLKAGNYTYNAVDAYGCRIQKTITITQPQALAATFTVTNTTCKFSPDGSIILNVTGGTAPFKYKWNGLDRGPNASLINITSGKYIIIVTDANSCSIIVSTEVLPGNCAPTADNDNYTTKEDTPITINTPGVIINDADPDQDELKIMLSTARDPNSTQGNINGNTSSFTTVNGGVFINNNGSFTYTPKKNFNGIERFVYKVSDGSLLSNFATVTIEVLAVNDPPIAIDDNYSTLEDTPFDGTVIPNDSDPDADQLTYSLLGQPNNAVVSFNADGTFRFVPVLNFNGTITFDYRVCDPSGLCDTAKVTVIVTPVNDPPVALDDTFKTQINLPFNNRVIDNDSDVDNDPLQYSALTQPPNGTLIFNADGTFIYTPRNGFKGPDTFTYRTCDPLGLCDTATVTILVQPIVTVNLMPSTATIKEGEKISITAVLTESIFENATVTIAFGGSAINNSDYTLTGNFVTITILAGQTTTTQEFTINAINDALRDDGEQVIANVAATSTPYVLIGTGSFINITDIYPTSIPLKPEENPDINPDPLVSPNKDGQGNDKFIIYNISKYPNNEVLIFNRWGNEVFKISGYNNNDNAFEGVANVGILTNTNKDLVDGVYYYVIYTTVNGVKNINRGYLILKR